MKTRLLNRSETNLHWLSVPLLLLAVWVAGLQQARAQVPPSLFTSAPTFYSTNHILSTTLFHWFRANDGQFVSPWAPMEGRVNWTGTPGFWKGQIKQMMRANIDMLYVHQYADNVSLNLATTNFPAQWFDPQLISFFTAYSQLRAQGYDVPKIAPFLDPQITWYSKTVDLATTAGKDAFANQYIRFYNMYYTANTDANADDYLARQSNKPVLDVYLLGSVCQNITSLSRADLSSRLAAAHPCFTNGFVMVSSVGDPALSFVDEKIYQFENTGYHSAFTFNGITSMKLNAGYWDQNLRTPGQFLARAGGVNFTDAWNYVNRATVQRVNVESWNEYDEGTGIYAATNAPPYRINGNPNNDTWSTTGDPWEYIKTTARGAASFCDVPAKAAKILWHNIPPTLSPGESRTVTVIVRNAGTDLWTGAINYKLGQADSDIALLVPGKRVPIDDALDEIPLYGGIFRGRAKEFTFTIQPPASPGNYTNHFQMVQEFVAWFGDTLTNVITVKTKTAAAVTLTNLLQIADGYNAKTISATTTPAGLAVDVYYNGSVFPPTAAGSYTVVGIINDANYYGSVTNTLVLETNAIPNWSFEAEPSGTTISAPQGGGNLVDDLTLTGWRFVNVDATNSGLTATIIPNASAGSHALRLDATGAGAAYFDQCDAAMHTPVVYGTTYLVSIDAAWIAGAAMNNLLLRAQEFDNTGTNFYTEEMLGFRSVSTTNYQTYSFMWTPQNPSTAQVGFAITPRPSGGSVSLSVDNVKIVEASTAPPPAVTMQPQNSIAAVGSTVTFSARAGVMYTDPNSVNAETGLGVNWTLTAGQAIYSPNKCFKLLYQTDGNLVLYRGRGATAGYNGTTALWNTGTSGSPGQVAMQGDGNLVVYNSGNEAVWALNSLTPIYGGSQVRLQSDGNLIVYQPDNSLVWASGTSDNYDGSFTTQWQESTDNGATWSDISGATSPDLNYTVADGDNGKQFRAAFTLGGTSYSAAATLTFPSSITMQPQNAIAAAGNTVTFSARAGVMYTDPNSVNAETGLGVNWTLTAGQAIYSPNKCFKLIYQNDGNLELYRGPGATAGYTGTTALWASGGSGQTPGQVAMQGDGNLVVYNSGGGAYWALSFQPGVTVVGGSQVRLQNDGNLIVYQPDNSLVWASGTSDNYYDSFTTQWQESTDNGATWSDIWGATLPDLNYTVADGDNGKQFRAAFTLGGTSYSVAAKLTFPASTTAPTNLVYSVSGGNTLILTWPGSHLGWYVQSNSVGVASPSDWFNIPGSESVTNLSLPISPTVPRVFYRMHLP